MTGRLLGLYNAMVQEARKRRKGGDLLLAAPMTYRAGTLSLKATYLFRDGRIFATETVQLPVELTEEEEQAFAYSDYGHFHSGTQYVDWRGVPQPTLRVLAQHGGIVSGDCVVVILDALKALEGEREQEVAKLQARIRQQVLPRYQIGVLGDSYLAREEEIYERGDASVGMSDAFYSRADALENGDIPYHFGLVLHMQDALGGKKQITVPYSCVNGFAPRDFATIATDIHLYIEVLWLLLVADTKKQPIQFPGGRFAVLALGQDVDEWVQQEHKNRLREIVAQGNEKAKEGKLMTRQERIAGIAPKIRNVLSPVYSKGVWVFKAELQQVTVYATVVSLTLVAPYGQVITQYAVPGNSSYHEMEQVAHNLQCPQLVQFIQTCQLNRKVNV